MRILATLLLSSLIASCLSQTKSCTKHCLDCQKGICLTCYQRRNIIGACSPLPSAKDHCDLYIEGQFCGLCQKGYALDVEKGHQGECEAAAIDNCIGAFKTSEGNRCAICDGGFPSKDFTECVSWASEEINAPQDNCMWGQREGAFTNCFRCKSGYMSVAGGCVEQSLEGCMTAGVLKKHCLLCDPYNGYNMLKDDGMCTHVSSEQQGERIGASGLSIIADLLERAKSGAFN